MGSDSRNNYRKADSCDTCQHKFVYERQVKCKLAFTERNGYRNYKRVSKHNICSKWSND